MHRSNSLWILKLLGYEDMSVVLMHLNPFRFEMVPLLKLLAYEDMYVELMHLKPFRFEIIEIGL